MFALTTKTPELGVITLGESMKSNPEFDNFNSAMDTILKADPKAVKEAMEAEKQANAEKREQRQTEPGKRKRPSSKQTS